MATIRKSLLHKNQHRRDLCIEKYYRVFKTELSHASGVKVQNGAWPVGGEKEVVKL